MNYYVGQKVQFTRRWKGRMIVAEATVISVHLGIPEVRIDRICFNYTCLVLVEGDKTRTRQGEVHTREPFALTDQQEELLAVNMQLTGGYGQMVRKLRAAGQTDEDIVLAGLRLLVQQAGQPARVS